MTRVLIAALTINLALSVAALAWLGWITAEPREWFPDAYAEKGTRGDPGPRGPRGPAGPPGPVGPDAEQAVDAVASEVEDVSSRVDDVESTAEDVQTIVSDLCDALELNYIYSSNSAIEELLTDLNNAC